METDSDSVTSNHIPFEERHWLWKPGQSGNPNGRPRKGESAIEKLRRKAEARGDALADIAIELAAAGNVAMWNSVFDRLYGKPAITIERSEDERSLAWAEMGERLAAALAKRIAPENALSQAGDASSTHIVDAEVIQVSEDQPDPT